jgi:NDP-sugar pyrophosphorylase family protein
VFPAIIERGRPFFAHVLTDEYWRDIGSPRVTSKRITTSSAVASHNLTTWKKPPSDVATAASVDELSILGEGCVIKPGQR